MSCKFFKLLVGEWQTKLRIPQIIVSNCGLKPKLVILTTNASSNSLWKVHIEKEEEDPCGLYFKKGWQKFAQDNRLEFADFLTFEFDGKSTYKVVIYGKSAGEKKLERQASSREYIHKKQHCKPRATTRDCPENPKGEEHIYVEIKEEIVFDDPVTYNQVKEEEEENEDYDGDENEEQEEEEEEVEEESYDIGKGPSFAVQVGPASAKLGVMCIPTYFFKSYMRKKKHEVELETVNGAWTVTLLPHKKRGLVFARFSRGWSDFARRNKFMAGDTIVFDMIKKGNCPKFIVQKQ